MQGLYLKTIHLETPSSIELLHLPRRIWALMPDLIVHSSLKYIVFKHFLIQ